jgi:hypothetical protein
MIFLRKENYSEIMKIRFFTDWGTPESTLSMIETEFNVSSIPGYKKTFDLTSGDDYTHAFVINTHMPHLSIPKEKVIGLAWEPPSQQLLNVNDHFITYVKNNMHRYLIGEKQNLPEPFQERYGFLNHNPMQERIPTKTKICSMIFSQKGYMEGHRYRRELVEAVLKTNLPIEIWGRGCSTISNDSRLKGEFEQDSVLPYEDYQFHICVENHYSEHYFSEKIVNALLSECTPIYYGCKTIHNYFPNQVISLEGNIDKDIKIIQNCLSNPSYKKINRQQVHQTTNPFFHLDLFG